MGFNNFNRIWCTSNQFSFNLHNNCAHYSAQVRQLNDTLITFSCPMYYHLCRQFSMNRHISLTVWQNINPLLQVCKWKTLLPAHGDLVWKLLLGHWKMAIHSPLHFLHLTCIWSKSLYQTQNKCRMRKTHTAYTKFNSFRYYINI